MKKLTLQVSWLLWPLISLTAGLRFSSIQIPALVQRGSSFWLACQFHLDPRLDKLYSVKWYRNEEEFYRLLWAGGPNNLGPGEQQHFGQPGVNVMMSSSNATHVRLLNASLESEGIYACEISTQNLSTIRYDREIKVYVLPQTKPNIIGFKPRYSVTEQVDLNCLSDFSRPQPALVWFINNHRVRQDSRWFQVDSEPLENKLGDLYAVKLRLRFKLTVKLIESILSSSDQTLSHLTDGKPRTTIRIECRYRLTDVVDVVFNELKVCLDSSALPLLNDATWSEAPVRVSKLRNQLSQSVAPASTIQLTKSLQEQVANQCSFPRLSGDDPLLVEVETEQTSGLISVNCSTVLSLHSSFVTCAKDEETISQTRHSQLINNRLQAWPQANQALQSNHKLGFNKPAYLWLQKSMGKLGSGGLSLEELGLVGADSSPQPANTPPFLEWFINNQEAPKSSVRYQPPLPVRPTFNNSDIGWPQMAASAVDYGYYFANFDSKPQQQHLELHLDMNKEKDNLKISDSKLSLRCSSTQAQLLHSETVGVTLIVGYWMDFPGSSKQSTWQAQQKQMTTNSQQAKRQGSSGVGSQTKLSWTLCICSSLLLLFIHFYQ